MDVNNLHRCCRAILVADVNDHDHDHQQHDHHPHSHGNVVANVGGDVYAEILLVPWQVQGNVVHVPGVDSQHEEEEDGDVTNMIKKNHLSCSASSVSSRLSRARRLDSQWMMKPE